LPSVTRTQDSPEYFAAYQLLVYDYYIEQASHILELPKKELKKVQMVYGPKMFSLIEKMGDEARVAPLPELHAMHPALRGQSATKKGAKVTVVFVAPVVTPAALPFVDAVLCQPGARVALVSEHSAASLSENSASGLPRISKCRSSKRPTFSRRSSVQRP